MKKLMSILLVLLMVFAVTACGPKGPATPEEVKGETYDAGVVSALVPDGWMAFPVSDVFDEYDGDNDPTSLRICKGGKSEWDLLVKPCVTINYYADGSSFWSGKSWYDDVEDIEPFDLGNYSWTGYTGSSIGTPYTILEGTDGTAIVQVMISMEGGNKTISLEDVDVQAIILSIEAK